VPVLPSQSPAWPGPGVARTGDGARIGGLAQAGGVAAAVGAGAPRLDDEHGRGLLLVESLSTQCGVYKLAETSGKVVWAAMGADASVNAG
jgi:hypothetical protein